MFKFEYKLVGRKTKELPRLQNKIFLSKIKYK